MAMCLAVRVLFVVRLPADGMRLLKGKRTVSLTKDSNSCTRKGFTTGDDEALNLRRDSIAPKLDVLMKN